MPDAGFSSSTNHCSSSSRTPIRLGTNITSSSRRDTKMIGGRLPQPARMLRRQQRLSGRSLLSRRFLANHLSTTVPIVLLLIVFCSDFAYLSGDSGGVLADEVTTVPPEETWTTSSNENVGTGEAAPFAQEMINDKSHFTIFIFQLFITLILSHLKLFFYVQLDKDVKK
uniref:Transmembrane protein n=1 Tax=Anopheles culicifacies TaxID=139723 RepID=A0A182MAX8_9DIPT